MSLSRLVIASTLLLTLCGQVAAAPAPQAACALDALDAVEAVLHPSFAELGEALALPAPTTQAVKDPRHLLVDFALQLRDIRYRRGGRAPATGFDCSGFVHYVFAQVLGIDLPSDSASQYVSGVRIARAEMQAGDLVFFHTRGKHVSHVGIYLGEGQFIHAPTTGERVKVNRLDETYWARRFAGARRPLTTLT